MRNDSNLDPGARTGRDVRPMVAGFGAVPRNFAYPVCASPPYRPTMLARVRSAAVLGIDAYLVDVETDIANASPRSRPWACRRAP